MQTNIANDVLKVLSSDNRVYGPIDFPTLVQWVRERRVQPDTWIHSESANGWFAAGSLPELQSVFAGLSSTSQNKPAAEKSLGDVAVEELRKFERFAPYSNEELSLLIQFCDVLMVVKDDVIIKKGDLSDSLFLILSGRVRARLKAGGSDTSLGVMEPGELFGEVAMLSQTPRSADVIAEGPTRLLQLTSEHFQELMRDYPALGAKILYNISRLLATRLAETQHPTSKRPGFFVRVALIGARLPGLRLLTGIHLLPHFHIPSQCLESFAIGLNHRDGDVTGFAGVDVSNDSRFSRMHTAHNFALGTVA
jgi:CRP/FNR family cyclic AMP-dependent transcriptional regulator